MKHPVKTSREALTRAAEVICDAEEKVVQHPQIAVTQLQIADYYMRLASMFEDAERKHQ